MDFIENCDFALIKHKLTDYLVSELRELDNVIVYCPDNVITNGIVSFNIEGYTSDEVGKILSSQHNICVRTGYHCAPFVHDFIGDKKFAGCVRVSFSGFNTKDEIDILINAIKELD